MLKIFFKREKIICYSTDRSYKKHFLLVKFIIIIIKNISFKSSFHHKVYLTDYVTAPTK